MLSSMQEGGLFQVMTPMLATIMDVILVGGIVCDILSGVSEEIQIGWKTYSNSTEK